jgi:hypothetical protein
MSLETSHRALNLAIEGEWKFNYQKKKKVFTCDQKKGFGCLTYGDQKWVSVIIWKMLIIGWQSKMGFTHHLN